jgi:hypothetical protein
MRRRTNVMIALGWICACAWIGVATGEERTSKEGTRIEGPPKIEHLAWSPCGFMFLDGPAVEAMTPERPGTGLSDDAGNVFWGTRCLDRKTGMITTLTDDYWQTDFGLDEGPASAFSTYEPYHVHDPVFCRFVSGRPLEEGDRGALWFGDFAAGQVRKLYRNPDKDNRWWFRRVAGGGQKKPPATKGSTIPALEADLRGPMTIQVMPDDRLIVYSQGSFYEYRDDNLVCLLGFDDYRANGPNNKTEQAPGITKLGVLAGDGTFYLGTYFGGGRLGVWRATADGTIAEIVRSRYNKLRDGHGLHSGFFCGPIFWAYVHNYRYIPDDILLLSAFDDNVMRRLRNSRVSTLCRDGEFRELGATRSSMKDALPWFRWHRGDTGPAPGPDNTCVAVLTGVSKIPAFLVTNIDYGRPVTGPQLPIPEDAPEPGKKKNKK